MKFLKYTLAALMLLWFQLSLGQKAEKNKPVDSAKVSELTEKVNSILELIKNNKADENEDVGRIYFDTTKFISLYDYTVTQSIKTGRKTRIDSIYVLIKDGYILSIQIFTPLDIYHNSKAPITLTIKRLTAGDFLVGEKNCGFAVNLNDALTFIPLNSYYPDDNLYRLTRESPSIILLKGVGINTVLDFRLYTDALALLGNIPNGIFQTDVRYKQGLNRVNGGNHGTIPANYYKLNFSARKLERSNDFVDTGKLSFSRTALMQKALFSLDIAVNLISCWLEKKSSSTLYWDFGGGVSLGKLARITDTVSVITQQVFTEFGLNLRPSSNIGSDLYFRTISQYSPQTDFNNNAVATWFFRFGGELYWNPLGAKSSRLFARGDYTFSLDHEEKKRHFLRVQLGYSVLLSKLVGK